MQNISIDQTVRSNTVQDLKDVNSQFLETQARKGEQLVSMIPALRETFDLVGDDMVELSAENETLSNKMAPTIKSG